MSTLPQLAFLGNGPSMGMIFPVQYTTNAVTGNSIKPTPSQTTPPYGVLLTPWVTYDATPNASGGATIAPAATLLAGGYLPLVTASANGVTVVTSVPSAQPFLTAAGAVSPITSALQLDVPRTIAITGVANSAVLTATVFGWDKYGIQMVEAVTTTGGVATDYTKKAFAFVYKIYLSLATVANYSVGLGPSIGLPYYVASINYMPTIMWNGRRDGSGILLGTNPLASAGNGNSSVTVTTPAPHGLVVGSTVVISGAQEFQGLTVDLINGLRTVVTVPTTTTFTYTAGGNATGTGTGGGTGVYMNPNDAVFTAGVLTSPATAVTGDTRGTYKPSTKFDGATRLTMFFYAAQADYNKNKANDGSLYTTEDGLYGRSQYTVNLS